MRHILFLLLIAMAAPAALAQTYKPQHPMDALTAEEIALAVDLLKKEGQANADTVYPSISVFEMPKADVLDWKPGDPIKRRAAMVYRNNGETYEAVVDLGEKQVVSHAAIANVEPMILDREWAFARDKAMADERWKKAMARRGYTQLKLADVFCTPVSAGYFPGQDYQKRRILMVPCYDRVDKLHPVLARPIEGVLAVVDTESGEVLEVIDRDIVSLPEAPQGYGKTLPQDDAPLKPVEIAAIKGVNFTAKNQLDLTWQNWSMHVRADRRAGIILSLVRFRQGEANRMIAYQMSVSELFVPYMDPDPTWSFKTYMDAGEFGLGYLISSLQRGIDCPADALMVDLTFPNDVGGTYTRPRALCVFERATGDPAWRHYNSAREQTDGRPEIELVVRTIPTLGNYDYVFDYVFRARGSITLRVGATGFDAIKSVSSADMDAASAETDTRYGGLIAPYTVAPNHDHFVNYRLDLDIDGQANSFVRDTLTMAVLKDSPTRKSIWRVKSQRYKTEGPVQPDHSVEGGEVFRVVNSLKTNALKQPPSYLIHGGHNAVSVIDPADPAQARAQFSANTFWITAYRPGEMWAAGNYPNRSRSDAGLPKFVSNGESIADTDIVVWYTLGFRHIPAPEDFPILPTLWHEVVLRPMRFFDRDPSSTLNPEFAK
jgi:primary-amine oxidase